MAYKGYLLKLGTYIFPHNYIRADSYSPYVNMQDIGAWTDEDGYLHRNAVKLKAFKCEFETKALMTNSELETIMANIRKNYTNADARQLKITAYVPELNDYVTQTGYLADFTPKIYSINPNTNVIKYEPIRFAFVGGVKDE